MVCARSEPYPFSNLNHGQESHLVLLRPDPASDSVNTHYLGFKKPTGLAIRPNRIALGTAQGISELHNVPAVVPKFGPAEKFDDCFLPRWDHVTGDIAIHEMAYADKELWVVNTRFSSLCVIDSFVLPDEALQQVPEGLRNSSNSRQQSAQESL